MAACAASAADTPCRRLGLFSSRNALRRTKAPPVNLLLSIVGILTLESRSQELPCQGFLRAEVLSQKCQAKRSAPSIRPRSPEPEDIEVPKLECTKAQRRMPASPLHGGGSRCLGI